MLHPEQLRATLSGVALFVLAYEMFREGVVEHLRIMHSNGVDATGWKIDEPEYQADVAWRHKSRFQASLLWFKDHGAVDAQDLAKIDEIRTTRNTVVHDLPSLIGTAGLGEAGAAFSTLVPIYRKIEIWWIRNFEMAINPQMAAADVEDDDIQPGPLLMLRMLADAAFGDKEDSWTWYNAFVEARRSTESDDQDRT
jgi:hypothetical protein